MKLIQIGKVLKVLLELKEQPNLQEEKTKKRFKKKQPILFPVYHQPLKPRYLIKELEAIGQLKIHCTMLKIKLLVKTLPASEQKTRQKIFHLSGTSQLIFLEKTIIKTLLKQLD